MTGVVVAAGGGLAFGGIGPAWHAGGHDYASHRGHVRARVEDALLVRPDVGLFAVADGMGGRPAGDVASRIACASLAAAADSAYLPTPKSREALLRGACATAHELLLARGRDIPADRGLGTTLAAAWVGGGGLGEREVVVAHVGDARVGVLRAPSARALQTAGRMVRGNWTADLASIAAHLAGPRLEWLTRDHCLGALYEEALRVASADALAMYNPLALTRALGVTAGEGAEEPVPDVVRVRVRAGDALILSTDGLHGALSNEVIAAALPYDGAARNLVGKVLDGPATDNASAIVLRF